VKPLVYWCRWHDARLRLYGRDPDSVWGQLVYEDRTERFHFDLKQWVLTLGEEDAERRLQLDDMGVERKPGG
jgi:hypothetical protein